MPFNMFQAYALHVWPQRKNCLPAVLSIEAWTIESSIPRRDAVCIRFTCSTSGTGRSDYIAGMSALEMEEEAAEERERRK